MKTKPVVNLFWLAMMVFVLALPKQTMAVEENIRNYIELFRSDLSAVKVGTINEVMKLSEEESKGFWPIYRQYEVDLNKLLDTRVELITYFVNEHVNGTFTDEKAKDLASRWFNLQEDRLALWKEYYGKFEKALSPIRAAQFVQMEHQIALLIDLNIASEMPIVGQ